MSVILSIAVLAFVAYDFVLLSRMRKALNEAIAAQAKLEDLFRAKPTSVGELTVDLKVDTAVFGKQLADSVRSRFVERDGRLFFDGEEVVPPAVAAKLDMNAEALSPKAEAGCPRSAADVPRDPVNTPLPPPATPNAKAAEPSALSSTPEVQPDRGE